MRLKGLLYYNEAVQSFILILDKSVKHDNGNELTNLEIDSLTIMANAKEVEKAKAILNGEMVDFETKYLINLLKQFWKWLR